MTDRKKICVGDIIHVPFWASRFSTDAPGPIKFVFKGTGQKDGLYVVYEIDYDDSVRNEEMIRIGSEWVMYLHALHVEDFIASHFIFLIARETTKENYENLK